MKKKIFGIGLAAVLSTVALASCGGAKETAKKVELKANVADATLGEVDAYTAKTAAELLTQLDAVTPSKVGYDFAGWYIDEALTQPLTKDVKLKDLTDKDGNNLLDLYAKFTIKQYTVTFKNGNDVVDTKTVDHGGNVDLAAAPTEPAGKKFDGWYNGDNKVTSVTNVTGNVELTAKFVELNEYEKMLADRGNEVVLSDDFETAQTIADFSGTYGTKGFFQTISQNGTDKTKNNVTVSDGKANLIDTDDAKCGTVLVADFGKNLDNGIVDMYMEIETGNLSGADKYNSYTPIQIYSGTKEVIGVRIDNSQFNYRLNGGTAVAGSPSVAMTEGVNKFKVLFTYNFETGKLSIKVNGAQFASDVALSLDSIGSIRYVSGDGNVKTINVDCVLVAQKDAAVSDFKTRKATALDTVVSAANYTQKATELSAAIEAGKTAVNAATTIEGVREAYETAVANIKKVQSDEVLAAVKSATDTINAKIALLSFTTNAAAIATAKDKLAEELAKCTSVKSVNEQTALVEAEINAIKDDSNKSFNDYLAEREEITASVSSLGAMTKKVFDEADNKGFTAGTKWCNDMITLTNAGTQSKKNTAGYLSTKGATWTITVASAGKMTFNYASTSSGRKFTVNGVTDVIAATYGAKVDFTVDLNAGTNTIAFDENEHKIAYVGIQLSTSVEQTTKLTGLTLGLNAVATSAAEILANVKGNLEYDNTSTLKSLDMTKVTYSVVDSQGNAVTGNLTAGETYTVTAKYGTANNPYSMGVASVTIISLA